MASERATPVDQVLVLAHGPSNLTLRTCRTLRSSTGVPVTAVASTEPGLGAVRRVRDRGIGTVDGHGPEAVRAALAGFAPDEVVLVVHDDVELPADELVRLAVAHAEKQQVVVPHRDEGHGDAAVVKASTACMLGTTALLEPIADAGAFGPGVEAVGTFLAVEGTVLRHDEVCLGRLASPHPDPDRPLLVAALIVRDESETLPACLDSLAAVVDRIEIADTGSIDDTVEIAVGAGVDVMSIEWRDDFAWARNQVLDRCRDARYVLWVDADERLQVPNPARFRQSLHTFADHWELVATRVVDVDESGAAVGEVWQPRLFRPDDVRFEGALHEKVVHVDGTPLIEARSRELSIDHIGYQRAAVSGQDKFERNLALARKAFENDPTAERRAHLYRSLARGGQSVRQARETLAEMDELLSDFSPYPIAVQALMLTLRANVCLAIDEPIDAEATARAAVEAVPADRAAVAVLVEALVRQGRHEDAVAAAALDATGSPAPFVARNAAAEQGAAWALVRAAVALGDAELGLAQVPLLSATRDPWPLLLDIDTLDLTAAARVAVDAADRRFVDELIARGPSSAILAAVQTLIEELGGSSGLEGPLRRAIMRTERLEEAPQRRQAYQNEPSADHAIEYARCVAEGEADLAAELLGLDSAESDRTSAKALGIAAEAWARRGQGDAAVTDAIEALGRWPGAVRAGIIAASGAAASGLPDVALDIVAAVRTTDLDPADPLGHELANVSVVAHLARGEVGPALDEAAALCGAGGDLTAWPELIEATAEDLDRFAPVLQLALTSDGSGFIDAARHTLPGDRAAITCLSYLAAGGQNADAVTTGIVTAAVHGREDVAELFIEHLDLVDATQLDGIVTVLRGGGHQRVADQLSIAMN